MKNTRLGLKNAHTFNVMSATSTGAQRVVLRTISTAKDSITDMNLWVFLVQFTQGLYLWEWLWELLQP
jgi:hypothetical protein